MPAESWWRLPASCGRQVAAATLVEDEKFNGFVVFVTGHTVVLLYHETF